MAESIKPKFYVVTKPASNIFGHLNQYKDENLGSNSPHAVTRSTGNSLKFNTFRTV